MSGDWKPGTVAKATVRGVPDVTVFRMNDSEWALDRGIAGAFFTDIANDKDATDVRPLVVLDLEESIGKAHLALWLRNNISKIEQGCVSPSSIGKDMAWLADQIEAQTKPPKPAEPTGLGAVVEDDDGRRWVRIDDDPELNKPWRPADMAAIRSHWQNVKAVRVLSEGVA